MALLTVPARVTASLHRLLGRRAFRALTFLVWIAVFSFAALFLTNRSKPTPILRYEGGIEPASLRIENPDTVQAGTPVRVIVRGVKDTGRVTLVVLGSSGSITTNRQPQGDSAVFALSSDATRLSGNVELLARAGNRLGSSSMRILPGPLQNTVDPIVGPRTIIADGNDTTMAVAFPMDVLGNVAEDGTPVDMLLEHADGETSTATAPVKGMIAWHEFRSRTTAGNANANATAFGQSGRAFAIRETPAPPTPFTLSAPDRLPVADGFSLVRIQTSPLADVNGNPLDDGTSVVFTWDGPDGRSRGTSKTVSGVAELVIEAPSAPSTLRFSAWSLGTASEPLAVTFLPATAKIPLRVDHRDALLTIRIGPVLGEHNAYVRDGTWATLDITGEQGGRVRQRVQLVAASAIVRQASTDLRGTVTVRVEVLGQSGTLSLRPGQSTADTGGTGVSDQMAEAARVDRIR